MVANYNYVEPILPQMIPKDYQNVVMFIKFVQTYFDVLKSSNVNKHTKMKWLMATKSITVPYFWQFGHMYILQVITMKRKSCGDWLFNRNNWQNNILHIWLNWNNKFEFKDSGLVIKCFIFWFLNEMSNQMVQFIHDWCFHCIAHKQHQFLQQATNSSTRTHRVG